MINLDNRPKIAFFVKRGLDHFIRDIADALSEVYSVNIVRVTNLKDIEKHMVDADICWFEWCDDLIIYASHLPLAKSKKILCRIHSYEIFTNSLQRVNWKVVDQVIFVADHVRNYAIKNVPHLLNSQTVVIPNGIKTNKLKFTERKKGFNIAYAGYINFKKGPMLLLHAFKAIHNMDQRYKLYIAGQFQEPRYRLYFDQMIKELHLEDSVIFDGWQADIDTWLENKQYIISTSVFESQHLTMMEAMAKGIKPLVHNFVGAESVYTKAYIWSSIEELVEMFQKNDYHSQQYRDYIVGNYQFDDQLHKIIQLFEHSKDESVIYQVSFEGQPSKFYLSDLSDHIQGILAVNGTFYEANMLKDIAERVQKDSNIIDVGAYIGNHTVFFAKHCNAQVYSVEPNPVSFQLLEKNIYLNGLEKSVFLHNIGLGKEKGTASVENKHVHNMGMSQLLKNPQGNVEIDTIDDLFHSLRTIDLIKIDVEGMELEVLQGARIMLVKHKPILYIETATEEQLIPISQYLKVYGYQAVKQFNATPTTLFIAH